MDEQRDAAGTVAVNRAPPRLTGPPAEPPPARMSLAQLIARAGPGGTVTIPDGLTRGVGPVRITTSVRLVSTTGAEVPDDIVVSGPAVLSLSGITATGVLIAAPGARLIARDCRFTSTSGRTAVTAAGAGCALELAECRFTGSEGSAVQLRGAATARLTECDFASFQAPAIAVGDPATSVEVADCRFAGMTGHAVLAEGGASARIAGCSFDGFLSERWTAIIAASSGSTVQVTGCRFGPMTAHGVFARGGSQARIDTCGFLQSADLAAVTALDDGSELQLTGCRFTGITGRGVEVNDGGTAHISDCDLEAAGDLAPVYAEGPGSRVSLTGCRISSVNAVGAAAAGGAELDVRNSLLDCPGTGGLSGAIGLGRDGSRLRITGECGLRGATLNVTGTLDHLQAAAGASVTLTTATSTPCPQCNGSGGRPDADLSACARCGGRPASSGHDSSPQPLEGSHHQRVAACADCHGTGMSSAEPCPECDGRGGRIRERTLQITVPAGVQTGHTLIAAGHGGAGLGGGAPGNLHIVLSVLDPPFRTVEDYFEKALGVRVADTDQGQSLRGTTGPAPAAGLSGASPDDARRELDDAVRREAIRLGYLPADAADDAQL